MGFIFAWGYFREDDQSVKIAKITPTRKFPRLQYMICCHRMSATEVVRFLGVTIYTVGPIRELLAVGQLTGLIISFSNQ